MTHQTEEPVSITSARTSRSADIKRRQSHYLISMGIRTVCFLLAVVIPGPARWVLLAAAFFLPYFAVIIANAADGRGSAGPALFPAEDRPQIAAKPGAKDIQDDTDS
ncbi:MAG: hypothetical protein QOI06_1412 [Nocardioidaceae bacterium]|jgi:Flp pilus assembly protein TadB|nr:hypothetical protein [Nocardioidaceae bacterium]